MYLDRVESHHEYGFHFLVARTLDDLGEIEEVTYDGNDGSRGPFSEAARSLLTGKEQAKLAAISTLSKGEPDLVLGAMQAGGSAVHDAERRRTVGRDCCLL